MIVQWTAGLNFFQLWLVFIILGVVATSLIGLVAFLFLYVFRRKDIELWKRKSNPEYPGIAKVRKEFLLQVSSIVAATLPTTGAVYLVSKGYAVGYGDITQHGVLYTLVSFAAIVLLIECYEYHWHRACHIYKPLWKLHKIHHQFPNPTPLGTFSNESFDILIQALPMFLLPVLLPVSLDLVIVTFFSINYAYGVYLHSGFEFKFFHTHNFLAFNKSYHHYYHHKVATLGKPIYCGFFFSFNDVLFKTEPETPCECCQCKSQDKTEGAFEHVHVPAYHELKAWIQPKP